jgi:hypothetical protein
VSTYPCSEGTGTKTVGKAPRSSTASHAVAHECNGMRSKIIKVQTYACYWPSRASDVVLLSWCEEDGRWSWDTRWYADHARPSPIASMKHSIQLHDRRNGAMLYAQQLSANQSLPLLPYSFCRKIAMSHAVQGE